VRADPFYDWALVQRVSILNMEWLPVLIELTPDGEFNGSAEEFTRQAAQLRARDPNSWAWNLRVPPFYEALPTRIQGPLRFVSVLARKQFLAEIYDGKAPAKGIRRFEIGRSTRPAGRAMPQPVGSAPVSAGECTPEVLVGVIDDGLAFAHDRFLSTDGKTRIEYFWDQLVPSATWFSWGYGRELTKRHLVDGIDERMRHTPGSIIDEDDVYRLSGHVDFTQPGHKPLAARMAHGTHVMDLACRSIGRPPSGQRPIVAVQLPTDTVADSRVNDVLMTSDCSKIRAPRFFAAAARPSVARSGSTVALSRLRRAADAGNPAIAPMLRAGTTVLSTPASLRSFCSRTRSAACSGVRATSSPLRDSRWHFRSSRRMSAVKSSAARRQALQAWRAARRPRALSTSENLADGSSVIQPDEAAELPCPTLSASNSETRTPAAANAYAVAHPVNPPPMMATSMSESPLYLGKAGTRDLGKRSTQGERP